MTSEVKRLKDAIAPILWLNCIFCMGVFEIPVNRKRFYLSAFYVVLMLVGYFFLLFKGIYILQSTFTLEFIIFYFVLIVNILVAVLTIILFWHKSENIDNIIKRCTLADETLSLLGIQKNYQQTFRYIVSLVVIWIMGMILLNAMHVIWMYRDMGKLFTIYTDICFCFPIMVNSVVDVSFAALIRCIQFKFEDTNILINNVVLHANDPNMYKIGDRYENTSIAPATTYYKDNKNNIIHLMQTLRQLHLEITKIARQINKTYCLQVLLEMAVHFTIITGTIYCLYASFNGQTRMLVDGERTIAMLVWGSVYALKIILVNNICTGATTEAYKTGEIVQSFEGSVIDDDMREEIHQFIQQIMLNSLTFTASGFFTIDNSFTGKFFATVMTYVVILIQMNTPLLLNIKSI